MLNVRPSLVLLACLAPTAARPQAPQDLPPITVTAPPPATPAARKAPAVPRPAQGSAPGVPATAAVETLAPPANDPGIAQSAAQGFVGPKALLAQPLFRTGEVLEAVPGLVVTQHSGEGKANQYFLRGFNLDHGTDLALTFDGMPVNMRTHGHGQGYADTSFIIPELLLGLAYRKGPYYASEGDFASAGAIHLDAPDRLAGHFAQIELGSFGHRRAVAAASTPVGNTANLIVAGEIVRFDGPWDRPDDLRKLNGLFRYANGSRDDGFALTAMAYSGQWYATDQIPQRAVDQGLVGRYGTLDPTDGGASSRYSVSGRWAQTDKASATRVNVYAIKSDLALYNNFTYVLDDPVRGDQFKQVDTRVILGGAASRTYLGSLGGMRSEITLGSQARYDSIGVGLFKTAERTVLSTVRDDRVEELSIGVYGAHALRWSPWLRTTVGARADLYQANVASTLAANSGADAQGLVSPKLGLVLGPWSRTEIYLNAGTGFHSNDARGTATTVDPASGSPVDRAPFLVRSKGAEIGVRTSPRPGAMSTLSAFVLDFESEIVFVGDAGTTQASRPSRRIGVEYTLRTPLTSWLMLDLEAASTRARFTTDDPGAPGRHIPGATEGVVSAGVSFANLWGGWFGGAKVRYFGPRPLVEDNSVRSGARAPVSARLGYAFADGLTVRLDAFNILNERSSQIDYSYASRLAGEAGAVDDVHFHPTEPRSFRLVLRKDL
ncbi:MAG: TonB-dependent receptor [Hyphomicrobiaceae bacterium]|nr:TonB-dependent receptor [Hyphomicrobiaceae bacterium]